MARPRPQQNTPAAVPAAPVTPAAPATPATPAPIEPAAVPAAASPEQPATPAPGQATAPAVPTAESAPVGTAAPAVEKVKKIPYRTDACPKLTAWPTGEGIPEFKAGVAFDPKTHRALRLDDFDRQDIWYLRKADALDKQAADCRTKAENFKIYGNATQAKAANRLMKIAAELETLKATLGGGGVNVDALLEKVAAEMAEAAAAAAAEEQAEAAAADPEV